MGSTSSQTIGYRYYLGLHMAICYGPVLSVNKIYVGKREAWSGAITASSSIQIFKPDLFGGDKKEGGIAGTVDILFGESSQTRNMYLMGQLGDDIPAFRGVLSLVFREGSFTGPFGPIYSSSGGGGYVASMSPYPKAWAIEVTDIPGGGFKPDKQNINSGSANGAHILYEAHLNSDWGLGLSEADLDLESFGKAADTLYAEGFGLSLAYSTQSEAKSFMQDILNLINGVCYPDRTTGKIKLILIRDDYEITSLKEFNEANIASLDFFERAAFAELVNEVVIKFRVRGDIKDTSIAVQDLAAIQAQGGIVSQTKDFSGVDSETMAARIGIRELKQLATPLARVSFVANREAWDVNPGDVIKFSWDYLGISQLVLRVTGVKYGTLENGLISIDAIEDVFGLPLNSYLVPSSSGWVETVTDPLPALSSKLIEIPYYILATTFDPPDFELVDSSSCYALSIAEKPAQPTFGYQVFSRTGSNPFVFDVASNFTPIIILLTPLSPNDIGPIVYSSFKGSSSEVKLGGYALIGQEFIRIDSIDYVTKEITIGRGALDTYPQSHLITEPIYLCDGVSVPLTAEYAIADSIDTKVATQTSVGVLDLTGITIQSLSFIGRQDKPYLPSKIAINSFYFPATIEALTLTFTWAHQDRLQQTGPVEDWFDVALGSPESGVLYDLYLKNNATNAILFQVLGTSLLTASYSPTIPTGSSLVVRLEMISKRDGVIQSFMTFSHIFTYTRPLFVRITESGDTRLTESGDRRILE